MQREDFATLQDLANYILRLEQAYTDRLFYILYSNAGNLQAWYNEANKVREAWKGKMKVSPKEPSAPWEQVGEIVIIGLLNRTLPEWFPIGLPIGSETRLSTPDAVVHVDVKTHKEGDPDLDRTQDVRSEQISTDENDNFVQDMQGDLGDCPPDYLRTINLAPTC